MPAPRRPRHRRTSAPPPAATATRTNSSAGSSRSTPSAMQVADERTVLGDFAGANSATVASRASSSVATAGSSSAPRARTASSRTSRCATPSASIRCSSTWSSCPAAACRRCRIAWDARPKAQGGQRWFHLYPDERIAHTRRAALDAAAAELELHVLRLPLDRTCSKNYDAAANTFATTVRGDQRRLRGLSRSRQPARRAGARLRPAAPRPASSGLTVAFDERRSAAWVIDPATGNAARSTAAHDRAGNSTSARSAMRAAASSRTTTAPGEPFTDHYLPALLSDGLYHPDGQQRDEVFDWGSFLSSRMYDEGRHLRRLPRTARRQAARAGQCGLRAVPLGGRSTTRRSTTSTNRARRAPPARRAT